MQSFYRTVARLPQVGSRTALLLRGAPPHHAAPLRQALLLSSSSRRLLSQTSSLAEKNWDEAFGEHGALQESRDDRGGGGGRRRGGREVTARLDAFDPIPETWPEKYPPVVFVGNLPYNASDEQLQELLQPCEGLEQVYIVKDFQGLSKGMGFASFQTTDQAMSALTRFNGVYFNRRMLRLRPSRLFGRRGTSSIISDGARGPQRHGGGEPTKTLYVGNLDWELTPQQFRDTVNESIKGIANIRLAVDKNTGWPRGFAHVEFKSVEEAAEAFEKVKELVFNGRAVVVDYAVSRSPRERREPSAPRESVEGEADAVEAAQEGKAEAEVELDGEVKA